MLEPDSVEAGQLLDLSMVRDNHRNLTGEFTRAPAVQQVGHAMEVLRTEERDTGTQGARTQSPTHGQLRGQLRKLDSEFLQIEDRRRSVGLLCGIFTKAPLDAHEEEAEIVILVLIGVQDVCSVLVEQPGHTRHQPFTVRAIDEKNGRILHAAFSLRDRSTTKRCSKATFMSTSELTHRAAGRPG